MTHTLHRFGRRQDLAQDFIVTAMPARGFNDRNCVPKQKEFLRTALEYGPVNIGNAIKGAQHRATKDLRPTAHWHRDDAPDPEAVIEEVDRPTTVSAVFDDYEPMQAFVAKLVEMDLGLSVNISSVPDQAVKCCEECGVVRHSVEYSVGFRGATEKLPDDGVCGVCAQDDRLGQIRKADARGGNEVHGPFLRVRQFQPGTSGENSGTGG